MRLFPKPSRKLESSGSFTIDKSDKLPVELQLMVDVIRKFPAARIHFDTADGVKKPIDVRTLLLSNPQVFQLAHNLALFRPLLFTQTANNTARFGILTPNFAPSGIDRLPSLKFLPLSHEVPLTSKLLPDAQGAVMLIGAANTEGRGMGGHGSEDLEQRLTIMGAISVGKAAIALEHRNHQLRAANSAVVTGLTDGRLGDLFTPGMTDSSFRGYGRPQILEAGKTSATLYMPASFLDNPTAAFGVSFTNASEIMITAGLQTIEAKFGDLSLASEQMDSLSRKVQQNSQAVHATLGY